METGQLHHRAVAFWEGVLASVGPDQWAAATPCAEWDVRALVNHVVGEELWTVPLLRGMTLEEVGDRFDGDVLGDRPLVRASAAASEAAAAADAVAPGTRVHLSYGDEDAGEYVRQLAADHLIHGWDLAAATGQDRGLDPVLVAEVATWFADREEMYRAGNAIGPRVPTSGDPQADLLAAFGRSADWSS